MRGHARIVNSRYRAYLAIYVFVHFSDIEHETCVSSKVGFKISVLDSYWS